QEGGIENLRQTGKAFASVSREVSPSVVFIQVESTNESPSAHGFKMPFGEGLPFNDDMLRRFFGERYHEMPNRRQPQQKRRSIGQGSGFVFSLDKGLLGDKSYIITNNHVVEHAGKIRVKFQNGQEYEAKIKGTDPQSDIAVLEVDHADAPALKLGDSNKLEVGEWVVAIGNPFGLSHTLTVGVVSATGRTSLGINDYEDFIQTDAAINPGNSGGPLVNLDGEVVGMNTAIFSRSGGYMGVGFAIPVNMIKNVATQLLSDGEVVRGHLGIVIQTLTPELAESFGLEQNQGILVAQVMMDSPAARAGLKQGDLIISFDGEPVSDIGSFRNDVSFTPPDTERKLTIIRNGEEQEIKVVIGRLTDEDQLARSNTQSADDLGLSVQTLTEELAAQFDAKPGEGVVVTGVQPGSIAAMAGIDPGTLILQVNRKPVKSAEAFKRLLNENGNANRALLLISKGGMSRFVVLQW
ncbi:MAG: DegQ family serine endoprotease, partial [Chromatiales bacterium]